MDLLQETSLIWNEFLEKPCSRVDLQSFWPRHPWHLLNPGTLGTFEPCHHGTFCPLSLSASLAPWHLGHEKLTQNDSLNVQIRPVDQKIQWYWFLSQLICTVTADLASQLDWPQKTTPKWLFGCPNLSSGSKGSFTSSNMKPHLLGGYIKVLPRMWKVDFYL